MDYKAPLHEFEFCLTHIVDFERVLNLQANTDLTVDVTKAILREAARICEAEIAPINQLSDTSGASLVDGAVQSPAEFAAAYQALKDAGLIGISSDPTHGGAGLPHVLANFINEMLASSCLALQISPVMTQGQIEALEAHASDEIKSLYLPKLNAGTWSGTMNLTEPQAGSDVGALTTRAEPNADGTYAITGQKIYISWGDCDFTENVVHLVLARLPGAAAGTKGISLFLVPKFIPDPTGAPGEPNRVKVIGIEEKMGLHGSPTCAMEYEGATGWMVGEAQNGMAAMFTMMNSARLAVGTQGIGIAELAYQRALAYAQERVQGRAPDGRTGVGIIEHPDVRRMLLEMKADLFAARAMATELAVSIDLGRSGDDKAKTLAAFLTPIVKTFGTETGNRAANLAIQIHGGAGFVRASGLEQLARDVRVTTIYEGTNGIQAIDLIGRKLSDNGEVALQLLDQVKQSKNRDLRSVAQDLRELTLQLLDMPVSARLGGASPYLAAFARLLGGHYHERAVTTGQADRTALAEYYFNRLLPEAHTFIQQARLANTDLFAPEF